MADRCDPRPYAGPGRWAATRDRRRAGGAGRRDRARRRRARAPGAGTAQPRRRGRGDRARSTGLRVSGRSPTAADGDGHVRAGRSRIVPNGADTTRLRAPRPRRGRARTAGAAADGPVIIYVGKLKPLKGVDVLVKAMVILGARRCDARPCWWVSGTANATEMLEQRVAAARAWPTRPVRRPGPPRRRRAGVVAAGDVLVLPSLSEGLPTVVCEALTAAGRWSRPPSAAPRRSSRDGETGLSVPPRTPARWPTPSRGCWTTRPCAGGWARRRCGSGARRRTRGRPTRARWTAIYGELTS